VEARGAAAFAGEGASRRAVSFVGTVADITERKVAGEQARNILESIADGFFAVDREFRFTYLNPQAQRILHRRGEELLGQVIWEVYPGLSGSVFERVYREAMEEGRPSSVAAFYPDHERWYEVKAYPAAAGISVYFRDVTESRRAEEALAESEARFRGAFEQSAVGIALADLEGRVLRANDAFCRMVGRERGEILGRTSMGYTHEGDVVANGGLLRAMKEGTAESLVFEKRYVRKDGGVVHAHVSASTVRDAAGAAAGIIVVVQDITDRKRAEETLRASEERFRVALSNAPVSVYTTDRELRYTWIHNPRLGFTTARMIGKRDEELLPIESVAELIELKGAALASGQRERRQITTRIGGQEYTFDVTVEPQRDGSGAVTGLTVATFDVTELEKARRVAEAASSAKDHFLAVLSHELRTPLTPVLATAQMLERDPGLTGELRSAVEMIRRNVMLEARLIDDLLDLTRIARGKLELHLGSVDVHEKIRAVAAMCAEEAEAKEMEVRVVLGAARHHVRGDSTRLQQILWNLLKNAIKFTPAGGQVVVETRDGEGGQVVVEVTDNGVGIPQDVLPRIFEAFEQGGREVMRQFGGLGLGLAISRALADMHGGTIRAESGGLGQGARFTLTLPTAEAEAAKRRDAGGPADGELRCRILLVEDHVDTRRVLTRLLGAMGCTVRTAGLVSEALRAAEEERFDLLVSDIGLPDGSGVEVMREVKARYGLRGIALSGFGMEEDIERSRAAGFEAHLTKPVNLAVLEATLRRVVKG
jgi:PAS domain S-box-containing protein